MNSIILNGVYFSWVFIVAVYFIVFALNRLMKPHPRESREYEALLFMSVFPNLLGVFFLIEILLHVLRAALSVLGIGAA